MKKHRQFLASLFAAATMFLSCAFPVLAENDESSSDLGYQFEDAFVELDRHGHAEEIYQVYNPYSGEHFYTANIFERNSLVNKGWRSEGIGWVAPGTGADVYRLSNPWTGDHHYTINSVERDGLTKAGWKYEGIGWQSGGNVPVYRVFNPNARGAGSHHYTTNKSEFDQLIKLGWRDEKVGWMAFEPGDPFPWGNANGPTSSTTTPSNPSTPTRPTNPVVPTNPTTPTTPTTPSNSSTNTRYPTTGLHEVSSGEADYVLNTDTGKIHPIESLNEYHVRRMLDKNRFYTDSSIEDIMKLGYTRCGQCWR